MLINDKKTKKDIIWLIGYGAICGIMVFIYIFLYRSGEGVYMPARVRRLSIMMEFLEGKSTTHPKGDHNAAFFLYCAMLGRILNIQSPETIYLIVQCIMSSFSIFCCPIVMFYVFQHKRLVALAAPLLWLLCVGPYLVVFVSDTYWGGDMGSSYGFTYFMAINEKRVG